MEDKNPSISLNELAKFTNATEKGKKSILRRQINPNPFLIIWYQLARARIKKSLELKGDLNPVYDAITTLRNRITVNKQQENDRRVSIDALENFIQTKIPEILLEMNYSTIKPEVKNIVVNDINIIVAPDLIVKGTLNGETVLGAVKLFFFKRQSSGLYNIVLYLNINLQIFKRKCGKR